MNKKFAIIFLVFATALGLLSSSTVNAQSFQPSCTNWGFSQEVYAHSPVTVNVTLNRNASGLGQNIDNAQLIVKGRSDIGPFPLAVVNDNDSGGVWQLSGNVSFNSPYNTQLELSVNAGVYNDACVSSTRTIVLGKDPAKIASGTAGYNSDGSFFGGCCDATNQCSQMLGTNSVCTAANGACQSGLSCTGGGISRSGADCDLSGANNRCEQGTQCVQTGSTGASAVCTGPCNDLPADQQEACITSRYPNVVSTDPRCASGLEGYELFVFTEDLFGQEGALCDLQQCEVHRSDSNNNAAYLCYESSTNACGDTPSCNVNAASSETGVSVSVSQRCLTTGNQYSVRISTRENLGEAQSVNSTLTAASSPTIQQVQFSSDQLAALPISTSYFVQVIDAQDGSSLCQAGFMVSDPIGGNNTTTTGASTGGTTGVFGAGNCPTEEPERANCVSCINGRGIWTAIGCVPTSPEGAFAGLLRVALGTMGGVVLLRLIYLGYIYQQAGSDKKITETRQAIFQTLGAILFVLFSVVILRIIGVNILDVVPSNFFG